MRGKWDTEEPLVHAPNQQRQQQQQHTIIEEQRHHPLHTATTPGWAIADRIVKEEPMEDKNNDSGVSPDHYTSNSASPRSRRSSSTANCSLSPGSATSQDSSSNIQCSNFEYSPQRVFKNCGSPQDFPRNPSIDDHRTDQPMDIVTSSVKPSCEDAEIGQDTLQCPICAFTTLNRLKFTEHLTSHCNTKCQTPEFVKTVLNQLSTGVVQDESNGEFPSHGERSEHESEEADEPGLRVPRVNSQGKVKTFRCKQCNFVAITKLEFWEHSRGHIKAEKLLTCPKCPFVTEYKHHLEYHLRNHFGSKPFKCDKCSYSCVNKSMLNSHLKSHSNVYQYRCANCSYATKYCHSLKLHLRKYSHQPAMVLNADGSPNPLPIIDIYGTRRGPKQKPIKTDDELTQQQQQTNLTNNNLQVPLTVTPQISPLGHHLPAVAPIVGLNGINGLAGVNGLNGLNNGNGLAQGQPMMGFPYNQLFAGFSLPQRYPLPDEATAGDKWRTNGLVDYLKTMDTDRGENDTSQDTSRCYNVTKALNGHPTSPVYPQTMMSNGDTVGSTTPPSPGIVQEDDPAGTKNAPLDLSKPDVGSTVGQQRAVNSPKASGTSRRKGIAVKLERRVLEDDDEPAPVLVQPDQEETFEPPAASSPGSRDAQKPANNEQQQQQSNGGASSVGNEFTCQYCEIAFGNVVMYTVHMGYHGYNDPYTCNMCGHQCTDKVSFFLHIARSKHS